MPIRAIILIVAISLSTVACESPVPASRTVTVFAAASLTSAFQSLGLAFTRANPTIHADFNFAGSSTLVGQVQQGAPADVFASADQATMQKLVDGRLVRGSPQIFATNRLQIVVPTGNPKRITGLYDLARPRLVVVLCGPAVPCGRYAMEALQNAGVRLTPVSQEVDVKAVVSKVELGEADAGIVYVTDVKAAGARVEGIVIPDTQNVLATYPIALLASARDSGAGRAFIDYVLSPAGQRLLAGFGFGAP